MPSKAARKIVFLLLSAAATAPWVGGVVAQRRAPRPALVFLDSTRERDGLRGPVRRVRAEVARLAARGAGRIAEGPRRLLEVTTYDAGGRRVENETYAVGGTAGGQETNVYDARGDLAETLVRDAGGRVISRTIYAYEFDRHGNWTKMVAALSVEGPAGPALEPVEVTYRSITYYSPDVPPRANAAAKAFAPDEAQPPASNAKANARAPSAVVSAATPPAPSDESTDATTGAAPATADEEAASLPDAGILNDKASALPPAAYPVGGGRRARDLIVIPVEVVIDEAGRVASARAPRGPQKLREAAEEAARRATFNPFTDDGAPRRVRGTLRYEFPYAP
jgi:hypothetical protein